jgi:hypothetical protein
LRNGEGVTGYAEAIPVDPTAPLLPACRRTARDCRFDLNGAAGEKGC